LGVEGSLLVRPVFAELLVLSREIVSWRLFAAMAAAAAAAGCTSKALHFARCSLK